MRARPEWTCSSPTTMRRARTASCPMRRTCTRRSAHTPAPSYARPPSRRSSRRRSAPRAGSIRASARRARAGGPRHRRGCRCVAGREPTPRAQRVARARQYDATGTASADEHRPSPAAAHRRARGGVSPGSADQRRGAPVPRRQRAGAAAHRGRRARRASSRRSSITPTPNAEESRRGFASRRRRRSPPAAPGPAYVLAGAGWHPGVIGIVAARIAERHHRPTVLIALPQSGGGPRPRLRALDRRLRPARRPERDGRAPRGLRRPPRGSRPDDRPGAPRRIPRRVRGTCAGRPRAEDLVKHERVDADRLGRRYRSRARRRAHAASRRLAPQIPRSRCSCPPPPSATLSASVVSGAPTMPASPSTRARDAPVRSCFGGGRRLPAEAGAPVDATFTLERNEWQGVVEPRLVLRTASPCSAPPIRLLDGPGATSSASSPSSSDLCREPPPPEPLHPRVECDHRGKGIAALIGQLLATSEPVLVLAADAAARLRHIGPRFGGFALASYDALERDPALADPFRAYRAPRPPESELPDPCGERQPQAPVSGCTWPGGRLSYALQHTYTSGSTVSAIRSPQPFGRYAPGTVRQGGSSRRSCAGRPPTHAPRNMRGACCGSSQRSAS